MRKNFLLRTMWLAIFGVAIFCNLFEIGEKFNLLWLLSMFSAGIAGYFTFVDINKNLYFYKREIYQAYLSKATRFIPILFAIVIIYFVIFRLIPVNYSLSLSMIFWIPLILLKKSRELKNYVIIQRKILPNNTRFGSFVKIFLLLCI